MGILKSKGGEMMIMPGHTAVKGARSYLEVTEFHGPGICSEEQHKMKNAALVGQGEADNKGEGCSRGGSTLQEPCDVEDRTVHPYELHARKAVSLGL
jgi:hypothetical protein